jgi:4-amino-4-deoxy-L-arabinose transferase-like glycosyltransferase
VATATLSGPRTGAPDWRHWPALAVAVLALVCVAINPVGFIGGGGDDTHYLEAARCWVAQGAPCLPPSHWWTRWPIIAPMAGAIALFGESRASVGAGALLYWTVSIALVGWIGAQWFGRRAGFVAAALLALTPSVTAPALQPNADIPELAIQLASLAAATLAFRLQSRGWAMIAGLLAAIAMQTRDTSLLFAISAALGWLVLPKHRRTVLLWAVPGFLAAMFGEALVYAIATGDPLWRYELAMRHAAIPSDELAANVDTSARPFFRPAFIAGWKRDMGIRVAWPIDPWLNLLASPKVMQMFLATALLGGLYWKDVSRGDRRHLITLGGGAFLIALLLVYGLAVDPKPRMFMALVAACAMASGALVDAAFRNGQKLFPLFVLGGCALMGLRFLSIYPATYQAEARAREWIAAHPGSTEIDDRARAFLTLLPEARALPAKGTGGAMLITTAVRDCSALERPRTGPLAHVRLIDSVGGPNPDQSRLCLWAYPKAGN